MLHRVGLATLLMDLLTPDEDQVDAVTTHFRFDIGSWQSDWFTRLIG